MPEFVCADLGMSCPFKANAPNTSELLSMVLEHGREVHNMVDITKEDASNFVSVMKK